MKLWYGAFALTTAILILALVIETPAQQGKPTVTTTGRVEVVILNATFDHLPTGPNYSFTGYRGMGIYCSSSSAGAPDFGNYTVAVGTMSSYAESIAKLRSDGYTMFFISADGQTSMWEKR